MTTTSLSGVKMIVSGAIGSGKTTYVQQLVRDVSQYQKVVVGYFDKKDCR